MLGAPRPDARWMTIVGIIGDLRTGVIDAAPMPQFYSPLAQENPTSMAVVVRTANNPLDLARPASRVVRQRDPDQPAYDVSTMEERVEKSIGQPQFQTALLTFFAPAALFLAAVGVYGAVAVGVAVGFAGVAVLVRLLSSVLYQVTPHEESASSFR